MTSFRKTAGEDNRQPTLLVLIGLVLTEVLLALTVLACEPEQPSLTERAEATIAAGSTTASVLPPRGVAAPAPSPTPQMADAPAPEATLETVETGVAVVTQALRARDASALLPLLANQVSLQQAENSDTGQLVDRDAALHWLNARWGVNRTVLSRNYVEHFELLEITTAGWARMAPITGGQLVLHLHRYNAAGVMDPLEGDWRIDTILY